MRILQIAHNHPKFSPGGTEYVAQSLHHEALLQGVDSYFLAGLEKRYRAFNPGTNIIALDDTGRESTMCFETFEHFDLRQPDTYGALREFRNFLLTIQPDVVHFHHMLNFGLEAIFVARAALPKATIALTLHDYYAICANNGQLYKHDTNTRCDGPEYDACIKCLASQSGMDFRMRSIRVARALEQCDVLISPSYFLKDLVARSTPWGNRIEVVENGSLPPTMEDGLRPAPKLQTNIIDFAYFGNVSKIKGITDFLASGEDLLTMGLSDFRLHVFGAQQFKDQPVDDAIESAKAALGSRLVFHGAYDRAELRSLMGTIDAVVFPSLWWENAPLVVYEAIATSTPLLAYPHGGAVEIVSRYGGGRLARTSSRAAMVQLMADVIRRPDLLHVKWVAAPPSASDSLTAHLRLYRRGKGERPLERGPGDVGRPRARRASKPTAAGNARTRATAP